MNKINGIFTSRSSVLYTAESGKHIILLKFVPSLSKKYTQAYCSCTQVYFLSETQLALKKGEVKNSTNTF